MPAAYKPELGQMIFGAAWGDYEVPRKAGLMLYELAKRLIDDEWMASYGVEYSNSVFEMHPYYWGDCTCGFDDEEDKWLEQHQHKPECFYVKFERYEKELEAQGINWFGNRSDEYNRLMREFAEKNGYKELDGIRVYCDCGYNDEYKKWRQTHDHKPDCRLVIPNFRYKPTGLEIRWYKYIGRGMSSNQEINIVEFRKIIAHCIRSVEEEREKNKQRN